MTQERKHGYQGVLTLSEAIGRLYDMDKRLSVHEEHCKAQHEKITRILSVVDEMSRKVGNLTTYRNKIQGGYLTLSVLGIAMLSIANLLIALISLLN